MKRRLSMRRAQDFGRSPAAARANGAGRPKRSTPPPGFEHAVACSPYLRFPAVGGSADWTSATQQAGSLRYGGAQISNLLCRTLPACRRSRVSGQRVNTARRASLVRLVTWAATILVALLVVARAPAAE